MGDNLTNNIEDTIFNASLPVNTLAMCERLTELLKELEINSLSNIKAKSDPRIQKLMWLLTQQFYGESNTIDLGEEWQRLYHEMG